MTSAAAQRGTFFVKAPMSGEIFTGHIKREVKLPKSVLSSRRPFLMTGHWNNPRHTWRNAENAACLLSCAMGGYLKRRFKGMTHVCNAACYIFSWALFLTVLRREWKLHRSHEDQVLTCRPKKTLNLLTWDFIGGIFLRNRGRCNCSSARYFLIVVKTSYKSYKLIRSA